MVTKATFSGNLTTPLTQADLEIRTGQEYVIPMKDFGVSTTLADLPTAGDATSLGLVSGTHGSASPVLRGSDVGATTATEKARVLFQLPQEYVAGQSVTVRLHAEMEVVADSAATADIECYESDDEAGIGSDLCTTAAQNINSSTYADYDFTITASTLAAGDVLDIEITTVATDAGNAAPNIWAVIGKVSVLLGVR